MHSNWKIRALGIAEAAAGWGAVTAAAAMVVLAVVSFAMVV